MYLECGIMVFRYTLHNKSTAADLYYDVTTQTLGSVSSTYHKHCTSGEYFQFLEYMVFVLAAFLLKYGFIIVQVSILLGGNRCF